MSVVGGRDINSPVVYGWAGGTGSGTGGEVGYALAERSLGLWRAVGSALYDACDRVPGVRPW